MQVSVTVVVVVVVVASYGDRPLTATGCGEGECHSALVHSRQS